MDEEEVTAPAAASWPEMSADLTAARSQAKSIVLDTQRATADGRILAVATQVEDMQARMATFEEAAADSSGKVPDEVSERLGELDQQFNDTQRQLEELGARIAEAEEKSANIPVAVAAPVANNLDKAIVDEKLAELGESVKEASKRVADLVSATEANRDSIERTREEHQGDLVVYAEQIAAVEKSIEQVGTKIGSATASVDDELAETIDRLKSTATNHGSRLADHDERATKSDEQIDTIMAQIADQTRAQDETATTIEFLQRRSSSLESAQEEAAAEALKEVRSAQDGLTANLDEIRSSSATTSDLAEVTEKLDAHTKSQQQLSSGVAELDAQFRAKLDEHDDSLASHATIIGATDGLLEGHSEILARNSETIRDSFDRITKNNEQIESLKVGFETHQEALVVFGDVSAAVNEGNISLGNRISRVESRTGPLENRADKADEQLADVTGKSTSLELRSQLTAEQITALTDRTVDLESKAQEIREQIAAVSDRSADISDRATHLEGTKEELFERIEAVNVWVTELDAQIETLKKDAQASRHCVRELDTRVGEIDQQLEDQIEAINDWSTNLNERTSALEAEQLQTRDHVEAVNDWVTAVDTKIGGLQKDAKDGRASIRDIDARVGQIDQLVEDQVDAINDWSTNLNERTEALEQRSSHVGDFTDQTSSQIDAINERVAVVDGRTVELEDHANLNKQKFEAVDDWVAAVDGRIVDLETDAKANRQGVREMDARLGGIDQQLEDQSEALNDWSTHLDQRTNELQNRADLTNEQIAELRDEISAASSQIQSASVVAQPDLPPPPLAAPPAPSVDEGRVQAIDNAVVVIDGRTAELENLAGTFDVRTSELEDRTLTINERTSELESRTGTLEHRVTQTDEQIAELRDAVNTAGSENVGSEIDIDRLSVAEHKLTELAGQLEIVQQRPETSSELEQQVTSLQEMVGELQHKLAESPTTVDVPEDLLARLDAAERFTEEVERTVDAWVEKQNDEPIQTMDELRDILVYRLDSAEERIDQRLTSLENTPSSAGELEQMQRQVAEAQAQAGEALEFSENLRLLQTDLVQALRKEISTQAELIQRNEGMIARLEAKLASQDHD